MLVKPNQTKTSILTKAVKKELRAKIFRHLDGIGIASTAYTLFKSGVFQYICAKEKVALKELVDQFKANEGYLNVALRLLCSQGWLLQDTANENITFILTNKGKIASQYVHLYKDAVAFIPHAIKMEKYILKGFDPIAFTALQSLLMQYRHRFGMASATSDEEQAVQYQILTHIEGILAGPMIVTLGINGLFHKYFSIAPFEVEEFTKHHDELRAIVNFFKDLNWFTEKNGVYNFTPEGVFFAKRAGAYGVTVSYLPMFMQVEELLFGNAKVLWERPNDSPEIHVNRSMNVWGSGSAHSGYFKKIDEIILDLFNRPIHEQPKGFLDMGCGDGTLLAHIFEIIWTQTKRGKMLDEYPLFIIGSDYNEAALTATRNTLNQADIWAKVVWGDIGNPTLLAQMVNDKYDIELSDLLHVRSFLDHNRVFDQPEKVDTSRLSTSTGAFAFRGRRIPNPEVEQNLIEHISKWTPYVSRFGLIVIELHTLPPALVAENLGKTACTAYDATHGYSDQYILELPSFLKAAEEAGLQPDPKHQAKYPNSDLATVSINVLKAAAYL